MTLLRKLAVCLFSGLFVIGLTGCPKGEGEGAADALKDAAGDAKKAAGDAVEAGKDAAEKGVEAGKDAVEAGKDALKDATN